MDPCHHGTGLRLIVDGGTASLMRAAVITCNEKSRTDVKGGPPAWKFQEVLTNAQFQNWTCYETDTCSSVLN